MSSTERAVQTSDAASSSSARPMRGRAWTKRAALLSVLAGCSSTSEDSGVSRTKSQDAGLTRDSGANAGRALDSGAAACTDGQTMRCGCDGGTGTSACRNGKWTACYCASMVSVQPSGDCTAGRYEGDLSGFAGTPVPFVPVAGLSLTGEPSLTIDLQPGPIGDLFVVPVGSGVLKGSADLFFNFEGDFNGQLDCSSKKFMGTLTGTATDFTGGALLMVDFTGTMTADYDAKTQSFVNGQWTLMVPDNSASGLPEITGSGDWSAMLRKRDAGTPP